MAAKTKPKPKTKTQTKNVKKSNDKKTKIKSFDFILFATVLLLLAIGIVMVLSASSPSALSLTGSSYTYVSQQFIAAAIGIVAMLVISRIDYKNYAKFYRPIYIISILLLLLVLIPGLGRSAGGANRWITLPIVRSFQPSEATKIGLIVFYAAYLTKYKDDLKQLWKGFFKPIFLLAPIILILIFVQSHFSAVVVIVAVTAIIMLMAGSRISHFISFGTAGVATLISGMYVLAKSFNIGSFRFARITAFLDPWADAQGAGWQIIQSLYAIGSGGLFGVGLRRKQAKIFIYSRTTK